MVKEDTMQYATTVDVERSLPAMGRIRLAHLVVCALLVMGVSLVAPGVAHAGDYTAYECYPNVNSNFPDLGTSGVDFQRIGFLADCSDQHAWKGIALFAASASFGDIYASAWVDAPAGTRFHTVSFYSFIGPTDSFNGPARYWGSQDVLNTGWHRDFQPYPNVRAEPVTLQDASRVLWQVNCAASLNTAGYCAHEQNGYVDYSAVGDFRAEVLDYTAPQLSIGGSAFDHQTVAGSVELTVAGTDQGSGVRSAWVDVNGQRYANVPTNCPAIVSGAYATQLRPCTDLASSAVTLNTTSAPFHDGANTLRVCVADFSTVQGTTANTDCKERTLSVDNTCTDSQGAQRGTAAALSAGFENPSGGQSRSLVVNSTQGAKLTGDLHGAGGGPVAGASICLYEQIDAPAEIRQLSQVTKTRSDGGFSLQLPAGPSRGYDVFYRSNDHTLQQGGLDLQSIVVPTLAVGPNTAAARVSARRGRGKIRNGQAARFTGRIPGPYAEGRVVSVQALVGRGCGKPKKRRRSTVAAKRHKRCKPKKWRTFKTLHTDASGAYSGIYRFTQTRGKVRYSFRTKVPDQADYPLSLIHI